MNPNLLDGDGMDGIADIFGAIGGALKTVAVKALPVVKSIFTGAGGAASGAAGGESLASMLVGAAAGYAGIAAQKKLVDAQARMAQAQTAAQEIDAQARYQKAQIDAAAAQTLVNGIDRGIIPPTATFAQAGQIVVREVIKSAGTNPDSQQGLLAQQAMVQAAQPDRTLIYVAGGAAALLAVLLFTRK